MWEGISSREGTEFSSGGRSLPLGKKMQYTSIHDLR
jgi:hypothetical protein